MIATLDMERALRVAVSRYGTGRVTTLKIGPTGGYLRTSDGRTFRVRSYVDALTVARMFGLKISRTTSEV